MLFAKSEEMFEGSPPEKREGTKQQSAEVRSEGAVTMDDVAGPSHGGDEQGEMRWYVLKVTSNRERSVRDSLIRRIHREGLEEYFGRDEEGQLNVVIPTERIISTRGGKKKVTEEKLFPGYMMVEMVLNDETWYLVRDTGGVGDFTGSQNRPIPMEPDEVERMLGRREEVAEEAPKIRIAFEVGEVVKIKEGTFEGFEGSIEAIDEASGKVDVLIEIFGRSTPVELDHWQVEKV